MLKNEEFRPSEDFKDVESFTDSSVSDDTIEEGEGGGLCRYSSTPNLNEKKDMETRSVFNSLWSPFRPVPIKQHSLPPTRPSATFVARQQRMSRPMSIVTPLPGFQEALLAQMERLNMENNNDPRSKRQSIRYTLITQNKGHDKYDWDFWAGIMCDYNNFNRVNRDLVRHVRSGIPQSIRGMAWQMISRAKDGALVLNYHHLLTLNSTYDKMIQRDLARTFPEHKYFKESDGRGQEGLYKVVRAFSIYDKEVGYCQGLAFIVGPMLLNMPDEEAFCLLVKLMNTYGLRGHFTPEMEGLQLRLYQFDALVTEMLPHISRHLKQQGINSTMYASQWFMTLFAYKFPLNLVFRIYDVIFTEGISSIFKFALSLLKQNEKQILGYEFEHLLDFLKNGLFEDYKDDDRRFVSDACELEIPLKRLITLEKEHRLKLQKKIAETAMIEDLQRTHRELGQQWKTSESDLNTLKQEHTDIQLQLQDTLQHLDSLKLSSKCLNHDKLSLETSISDVPKSIESKSQSDFENLCKQNALLNDQNSVLQDRLQTAEITLIDIKMRYAQSENEKDSLHKKLLELKKLMIC